MYVHNFVEIPYSHILVPLPEVLPVNSPTGMQELIHINFPFTHERLDSLPHHIIKSDAIDSFKHFIM